MFAAIIRRPWDVPESRQTPECIYHARRHHRREFLETMGRAALSAGWFVPLAGCARPTEEEVRRAGAVEPLPAEQLSLYPAKRNEVFTYGREESLRRDAAEYTNFYEFSSGKDNYRYVDRFEPAPWSVEVGGLCSKPQTFDLDDLYARFPLEERAYRHRCVETWAMCVPWTGFRLRDLLAAVEPPPSARYVSFETFNRPDQASEMRDASYPWPYTEGLTIEEATNELAFIATGIYGEPLPKQHGAPIRLVVPWKYGFKSSKSIVRITLSGQQPATFWNTLIPHEYGVEANVDPDVPHPRWSQKTEWMLGSREVFDTQKYNGYGDYVAA
ncbi:MAG: protein-methionine-sulfoxide reductase catalytic subunit MsrP, partial [Planctomycetaceae bacterium]